MIEPDVNNLVQFRFVFRGVRATRRLVFRVGRHWLKYGTAPEWVTVEPVAWWEGAPVDPEEIRAYLNAAGRDTFGCPGVVRYYARPDLVMCDFDHEAPVTLLRISEVLHAWGMKARAIEYHRTRRGWHVAMVVDKPMVPASMVALQAILGSDLGREAFNLQRVLSGMADNNPRWNLLFERKLSQPERVDLTP